MKNQDNHQKVNPDGNHQGNRNILEAIEVCKDHIDRHSASARFSVWVSIGAITIMMLLWGLYFVQQQNDIDSALDSIKDFQGTVFLYEKNMELIHDRLKEIESGETPESAAEKIILDYYDTIMKHKTVESKSLSEKLENLSKKLGIVQGVKNASAPITPAISDGMVYAFNAFFFFIFILAFLVYRFHAKEIARNEQCKLGFIRIKMATETVKGTCSEAEIQKSLVEFAFGFPPSTFSQSKKKKKTE